MERKPRILRKNGVNGHHTEEEFLDTRFEDVALWFGNIRSVLDERPDLRKSLNADGYTKNQQEWINSR